MQQPAATPALHRLTTAPATLSQTRYVLALILELSGGSFAQSMEAALAAEGVPTDRTSWIEAVAAAGLTVPSATRLISALLRLKALDAQSW